MDESLDVFVICSYICNLKLTFRIQMVGIIYNRIIFIPVSQGNGQNKQ